jgi:glycosyltransferase involved in cell wall biosynthesis
VTKRVVIVVSHPGTARAFLGYQLRVLCETYRVSLVANATTEDLRFLPEEVRPVSIRLERRPAPIHDLVALLALYRLFRRERVEVVHSMTPKAGLLAMIAASASRVPVRLHTFMGEVWATRRGWSRWLLRSADRLTAALATDVLVVSATERDFLRSEGVLGPTGGHVLAKGSVAGVDSERFAPEPSVRRVVRAELGIEQDAVIFLFLGRLARDKGVVQLVRAWQRVVATEPAGYLVLVGPDEEGLLELPLLRQAARTVVVGHTSEPERYVKSADVLCLPSRREGFGNVVIEAACAAVPAIASRIYGLIDAVEDGETGLLVAPDDVTSVAHAMTQLLKDPERRRALGDAARERAVRDFSQESVAAALLRTYEDALRGGPPPAGDGSWRTRWLRRSATGSTRRSDSRPRRFR